MDSRMINMELRELDCAASIKLKFTFRAANKVITDPDNSWKPQKRVMNRVNNKAANSFFRSSGLALWKIGGIYSFLSSRIPHQGSWLPFGQIPVPLFGQLGKGLVPFPGSWWSLQRATEARRISPKGSKEIDPGQTLAGQSHSLQEHSPGKSGVLVQEWLGTENGPREAALYWDSSLSFTQ